MHEMSLCEGILDIMESEAEKQQFKQIKKVWLQIGDLATVEIEALKFCYDVVVKNTVAMGSELIIEHITGKAWCLNCCQSVSVTTKFDACPDCGNYQLQLTQGDELRIKEMEVE